ncbi:hypothetical protein QUH01_17620, partial [Klebsiella michiganensis]|uniref:hypothetical protein n=2 Tax=Klebsiella michiganensis TaxID=1134687 RepID=UPI0025A02EF3
MFVTPIIIITGYLTSLFSLFWILNSAGVYAAVREYCLLSPTYLLRLLKTAALTSILAPCPGAM